MRKNKTSIFLYFLILFLIGCNQGKADSNATSDLGVTKEVLVEPANDDSLSIIALLKNVYKWHEENKDSFPDFDVKVEDTVQVGLNYDAFDKTFNALKETNYFSNSFLMNYKKIGGYVNKKLTQANPKYLDEINFPFQEADSWSHFQDDAGDSWNFFKIADFKILSTNASLKWWIQEGDYISVKYPVRFTKETGKWKVSYLDGFDIDKYYE